MGGAYSRRIDRIPGRGSRWDPLGRSEMPWDAVGPVGTEWGPFLFPSSQREPVYSSGVWSPMF